jgi:sugar-specific transcriptional regulator TrmB
MNKTEVQLLAAAGLSEKESIIYAALLGEEPMTISALVKKCGLHRPAVYGALPSLVAKGLASKIASGKGKRYIAESPARLARVFDERATAFRTALEELGRSHKKRSERPVVTVANGRDGMRAVLEDLAATLKSGDTFFRASSRDLGTDVERFVPKHFRATRDAKKLEQFVITNSALKESPHKKRIECYSKMIPKSDDPFTYDIAALIYADRVAFVDYRSETAITITHKRFARFQERLFRSLFKRL